MTLKRLAALHSVATSWSAAPGRTATVPDETVRAALAALGVDASTPQAAERALAAGLAEEERRLLPPTLVRRCAADAEPGGTPPGSASADLVSGALRALPPGTRVSVVTEDGLTLQSAAGLPPGVHRLHAVAPDGRTAESCLIVAPWRAPEAPARCHGLLVQLYSVLSSGSWGMGDLEDLATLVTWAGRELGCGFVQVNPLHAALPGSDDPSPYRPSSRRYADHAHLRIESIPEYARLTGQNRTEAERLAAEGAGLRRAVLERGQPIDHRAVRALKLRALELLARVPLDAARTAAFGEWRAAEGRAVEDHATFCALAEVHGTDWRNWPAGLRDPRSAETALARASLAHRVTFHARLAWLADGQLAHAQLAAREAGMELGLVHDLAVGVHPSGADTWAGQGVHAADMSVGAPPDAFNSRGQDWGLPPWRPDALAARAYAPFRELLRAQLRHCGALRIDHVMGLFRLWWVPEGAGPAGGTYVRYDAEAMLAVLVLEAHRAGAVVIGEDLGTVEDGVREELRRRGILGTSVLWFEKDAVDGSPAPPGHWRDDCLATATTHDLPPTAARLGGHDVRLRARLGLSGATGSATEATEATEAASEVADRLDQFVRLGLLEPWARRDAGEGLASASAVSGGSGGQDAVRIEEERVRAVYRFLRLTPARLLGVWLPDGTGDRRPQNVPGTSEEYPNWRLPVTDAEGRPVALEELTASRRTADLVAVVRGPAGRQQGDPAESAPPGLQPAPQQDVGTALRSTAGTGGEPV